MGDRLTNELKKKLKRAKDDHDEKMCELGSEEEGKNGSLSDW